MTDTGTLELFGQWPRRLTHDEIMAGFAKLRRDVEAMNFPLQPEEGRARRAMSHGSTAPGECPVPGDALNAEIRCGTGSAAPKRD